MKKGISILITTVLLLPILLSVMIMVFVWMLNTLEVVEEKENKTEELLSGLGVQLVIDNIHKNTIYLRNNGNEEFNGTIIIYLNNKPTCSRVGGIGNPYSFEVSIDIKPNEVVPVEIGCCISEGQNEVVISTGKQRLMTFIEKFNITQQTFQDWERTQGNESAECLVLNYASCSSSYNGCTIDQVAELETYIISLDNSETWYVEEPPYTWRIENVTGNGLCCRCGHCFVMLARAKFFFNSGILEGKKIWLSGDANETPCKTGDVNGIYINDNMYVFLNGHLLLYNGTSYGGIHLTGPLPDGSPRPESKDWCIKPIDLTGTPFSKDCEWNDVLIAFEDYCQASEPEAGGVYGMYLTVQ